MAAQFDLTPSIIYVGEHGSLLEKARLLRILMDEPASPVVYEKLLSLQNTDGGFPSRPRQPSASAVDSTLTALWQLDELGMFETPQARRGLDFLANIQLGDGGWDENPDLPGHDLPPWIRPGEAATRMYLSTYAAYWLGQGGPDYRPALQKGAAFLAAWQGPARRDPAAPPPAPGQIPGYLHNNWLGTSAFFMAGDDYAQNAARGLEFLQSRPLSGYDDSQLAWVIDCLVRAGLPAAHPFVQAGLSSLRERRAPDGSWSSEDEGPAFVAAATVSVIKVIAALENRV
jgi:hypothetical protein